MLGLGFKCRDELSMKLRLIIPNSNDAPRKNNIVIHKYPNSLTNIKNMVQKALIMRWSGGFLAGLVPGEVVISYF